MRAWISKIFLDSGSEENIVDSGEESVPVDLKVDSSDSDNNIFIFIIRIRATSRIKLFFYCLDSSCFAVITMDYLSDKYTSQAFQNCVCFLYYS